MSQPPTAQSAGHNPQGPPPQYRRPLSFSEAFRFTPLTTSPLHPSDQIPLPKIGHKSQNVSLTSAADRKAVAGIKVTPKVHNELQRLLQPESLSEFKFKTQPKQSQSDAQLPELSTVARHVYNGTPLDVAYRPDAVQNIHQTPQAAKARLLNGTAHGSNFTLEIPNKSIAPQPTPRSVVQIQKPDGFRREDYAQAPDSPKRRKLNNGDLDAARALRQRTQRELGDQELQHLQSLVVGVLEAKEKLSDDGAEHVGRSLSGLLEPSNDDDDFPCQMTLATLDKLQTRLKALADLKRLDDIANEHISALRQLCEGPIKRTQTTNLRLDDSPSDDDVRDWQKQIESAEIGVGSASVLLLTAQGANVPDLDPEILSATLGTLINTFESCLIPVVESRPDGPSSSLFKIAGENENTVRRFLEGCRKLLEQMSLVCIQRPEADGCKAQTEFLAARLIFVQNSNKDKTSALGTKTYERTRKLVMSSLARMFAASPRDRKPILDEILSSVDKLPSTSRSARQYSLGEGKSIMLISALLLQLVQTFALGTGRKTGQHLAARSKQVRGNDDDSEEADGETDDRATEDKDAFTQLRDTARELYSHALLTTKEIILYLVGKAEKVSKTGDSPYRNILDLFIEDLVLLLPLPEWPAAPALLECLYSRMTDLAQNEKAAGVKNMALESLGTIGAAIATSKASTQAQASSLAKDSEGMSDVGRLLTQLASDHFSRGLSKEELVGMEGPFHLSCRYYSMRHGQKDNKPLRSRASHSFFLVQYAMIFCQARASEINTDLYDTLTADASTLLDEIEEAASESSTATPVEELSPREAHLAYLLSILNMRLCRQYELIAHTLLASLASDQAQVRSRSIKSVVAMLETDPSLLNSQDLRIDQYIFPCASDDSALVRDAALSLIAQFLITKPAYEERGIKKLIECTRDGKIGVQKRSIGHLAEVYARESRPVLKAWIAETFLRRTAETEDSVAELARRTLTDAWFTGNYYVAQEPKDSAKAVVAVEEFTAHIVRTLENDLEALPPLLTRFLVWQAKNSKAVKDFNQLLSRISDRLFNMIIAAKASRASLQLLVCLAQARPEALAPAQLSHLRQYLRNFTVAEELLMFKAVIAVFQHVLPRLPASHQTLLNDVRSDIMASMTKLADRRDLDDAVACLRAIEDVVPMPQKFLATIRSIVTQIAPATTDQKRKRLILLLGSLGKHLDVEKLPFKGQVPGYTGGSVSGFLADLIFPYATTPGEETLQLTALDSLGCICQAWPAQFNKGRILGFFLECLQKPAGSNMRKCALKTFEDIFVGLGETQDELDEKKKEGEIAQDLKRMGGNDKIQSNSSAISQLASKVFGPIAQIALTTEGPDLLVAARTITSMSKHGMFHPKDYAGVFIALETCEDAEVRELIGKAHTKSHTLHESVWEREYVNAVQEAFRYQLKMSANPSGSKNGTAKLAECFATVNTSGSKYVKKFVSNLITRISTDTAKLDISEARPDHLLFVRFVAQNLAFFEYSKMEDLLHTVLQLEIVFSKNGGEIAQAIESNLPIAKEPTPQVTVNGDATDQSTAVDVEEPAIDRKPTVDMSSIDQDLLKRLATAACAVTVISEARSHLKRQYGITRDVRATMAENKQAKENNKTPVRVHGITGERFTSQTNNVLISLDSPEAMLQRCREFYELMNIDDDVVVGEDGEEMQMSVEEDGYMAPAPRGKKRKSVNGSTGGTPRKRGRPRKNTTPTRRSTSVSSHDDPDADFMG